MATTSRVQTLRSTTKGQRPASGTREVGELYVNLSDSQLGVINVSKNAQDLVAIRFFNASSDYAVGDYVVQAGQLYRAKIAITSGAFNAANWDLIYNRAQVDAADALKLDASAYTATDVLAKLVTVDGAGSGLDADLLDGQNGTFYATASSLAAYAPLASPVFTGNPTGPTPAPGDNDTSLATTAYVRTEITGLSLGTTYAPINSPTFTGNPTGPTPAPGDSDTSLATTAFVANAVSGFAPIASPTFTGDPKAPTPATADSDTSIATTAFVKAQAYVGDAPSDGITYGRKNASWVASIGGATVSDTAPGAPLVQGQLFWESDTGALYVWYNDGNSSQWVMVSGTGSSQQTDYVRKAGDTMTGALTATALAATGQVVSGQEFVCSTTNAVLATTGAGTIFLRPNGTGSATGQATLGTTGSLSVASIIAPIYSAKASGVAGINNTVGASMGGGGLFAECDSPSALTVNRIGSNGTVVTIEQGATVCGSISVANASSTAYNTSSDERLKDFIGPYDPLKAIDIIRRDPVRDFTWKTDGSYAVGWGAQTSYAVSADLATPPADEVKDILQGEEGFMPWGTDQSKRTPYLWAALAWALDRIDDMEARLAALEAV